MAVSPFAAAASWAGAVLDNISLFPPLAELYDHYQIQGFQGSPDDHLHNLAAGLSLTDDSNRFSRSVSDLNPYTDDGLSAVQRSLVRDEARRVRGLCDVQQAWIARLGHFSLLKILLR